MHTRMQTQQCVTMHFYGTTMNYLLHPNVTLISIVYYLKYIKELKKKKKTPRMSAAIYLMKSYRPTTMVKKKSILFIKAASYIQRQNISKKNKKMGLFADESGGVSLLSSISKNIL